MRTTRLGTVLLFLGLAVGCVAGTALLFGFRPSHLPAALLDLAAYKLAFIAALGLIAVGAIARREGARRGVRHDVAAPVRAPDLPPPGHNGTAPRVPQADPPRTTSER